MPDNQQPDRQGASIDVPEEMIRDLGIVAALPVVPLIELAGRLEVAPGILTRERLRQEISSLVPADACDAVATTIQTIRPKLTSTFLGIVDQWRRQSDENIERFPDEQFKSLQANLGVLVRDYPALRLMRKADVLIRATGNEFESVKFLCDLRPVFDDDHTHVEGCVLLANLRILYLEQSGARRAFELALSEDELELLASAVEDAQGKIAVLKQMTSNLIQDKDEQAG